MIALLKWLVRRFGMLGWISRILGLGLLLPVAVVLRLLGWPVMLVLGALALPVLFLLFVFGLPVFLVLIVGAGVLGLLFLALGAAMVALKIAVFVVLPILLAYKVGSWVVCAMTRKRRCSGAGDDEVPDEARPDAERSSAPPQPPGAATAPPPTGESLGENL